MGGNVSPRDAGCRRQLGQHHDGVHPPSGASPPIGASPHSAADTDALDAAPPDTLSIHSATCLFGALLALPGLIALIVTLITWPISPLRQRTARRRQWTLGRGWSRGWSRRAGSYPLTAPITCADAPDANRGHPAASCGHCGVRHARRHAGARCSAGSGTGRACRHIRDGKCSCRLTTDCGR